MNRLSGMKRTGTTRARKLASLRHFLKFSAVVICHAETPMLPLGQPEFPDQDKGVCDGIADY
jgi:hypothetical protein